MRFYVGRIHIRGAYSYDTSCRMTAFFLKADKSDVAFIMRKLRSKKLLSGKSHGENFRLLLVQMRIRNDKWKI